MQRPIERPAESPAALRALAARVAGGDEWAFEELYVATAGRVHGLVLSLLRDRPRAEEVTQEVFLQVWREAPRYRSERGEVLAWMLTIAHRRAVDRVRSEQAATDRDRAAARRDRTPAFDEVADQVERELERLSQCARVRRALGILSEVQRESLLLVYFGGRTHAQAAAALGVPLGTVKTRVRNALQRLRDLLVDSSATGPAGPRLGTGRTP
ncbi:ECF RNA polymerase sigma factor SigK [Kitasatospora sp. NBC_01250]|uniref:ECF RNA polymerase sigma factor SigK n=1 Tax=Kitasatospora sp. NBC_01250 TaxID=2903571 RepID=UPI002E370488|nr:ECF RNA polymerase sigma factor SigK [Kitasatospora sp. NBC_01250]